MYVITRAAALPYEGMLTVVMVFWELPLLVQGEVGLEICDIFRG